MARLQRVEQMTISASQTLSIVDQVRDVRARISGRLELGLSAKLTRYGLCRDLSVPLICPVAKIPITVRPLEDADMIPLFAAADASRELKERREAALRRVFRSRGAHRGFVAVDERTGTPCYAQWLFGVEDNSFVSRLRGFPILKPRQALLENAYTPINYRGLGIMSAAMALIAERAADIGASEVLTFVGTENVASLKGCQRAGFNPVMLHHNTHIAFSLVRRDSFEDLPEHDPRRSLRF